MVRSHGGGSRRRRWSRIVVATATCSIVLHQTSPAVADVDSVQGSATGVSITGTLWVIPPTPTVSLSAGESSPVSALGPFMGSSAGVSLPSPFPFNVFTTGALSVSTSAGMVAGESDAGFVRSAATVLNVVLGPNIAVASSIASSCRADGTGATGTTIIQGGMLNGQPFPPTPTPPPNTVIAIEGLGTVVLNEQLMSGVGEGVGSRGIVVNAVHARFASGAAGGILPREDTAEAIIGQVTCEAASSATAPTTTATTAAPPTTSTPLVTTAIPRVEMPATGSESRLPLGLSALGLAVLLRVARRPQPMRRRG